jgi:hypothetical protein
MGNSDSTLDAIGSAAVDAGKWLGKTATKAAGNLADSVLNPIFTVESMGMMDSPNIGASAAGYLNSLWRKGGRVKSITPAQRVKMLHSTGGKVHGMDARGNIYASHPLHGNNIRFSVGHPLYSSLKAYLPHKKKSGKK